MIIIIQRLATAAGRVQVRRNVLVHELHVLEQRLHVEEQFVANGTGARIRATHERRMLLQDAQVKLQLLQRANGHKRTGISQLGAQQTVSGLSIDPAP